MATVPITVLSLLNLHFPLYSWRGRWRWRRVYYRKKLISESSFRKLSYMFRFFFF